MSILNRNTTTGNSSSKAEKTEKTEKTEKNGFFDVTTQGYGYLNDIRLVDPAKYGGKGDEYLACRISALNGPSSNIEYLRHDVIVRGSKATDIIMGPIVKHLEHLDAQGIKIKDARIEIAFRLGDVKPELFTYKSDTPYHKKGDAGVSMKGRLLRITHLKLDGVVVDLSPYLDDNDSQEETAPVGKSEAQTSEAQPRSVSQESEAVQASSEQNPSITPTAFQPMVNQAATAAQAQQSV